MVFDWFSSGRLKLRFASLFRTANSDAVPQTYDNKIAPVVILNDGVNPDNIVVSKTMTDTSSTQTIFTTANDLRRQFYIDKILLSASALEETPATQADVVAVINGVNVLVAHVRLGTQLVGAVTPAQSSFLNATNAAIPVDRNTNISLQANAAGIDAAVTLIGHYEAFA